MADPVQLRAGRGHHRDPAGGRGPPDPDHAEDVTGWAGVKLAALLEHRSQHRSTMHIDPDDDGTQLAAFRKRVLDRLAEGGARAGVEHAELFKAITEL